MPVNTAMWVMTAVEFLLWSTLGYVFWMKRLQGRFPALNAYFLLRVVSTPILLVLLYGQAEHWFSDWCFVVYFFAYWAVYVASAVLLFLVTTEVFRTALSAFQGLVRFGLVVFRWAAVVSLIVSLSSLTYGHRGILMISQVSYGLMHSVSIIELCLLAFLCLSMNALSLSPRDLPFGIALGFGLLSSSDFVLASFVGRSTTLNDPVQYVSEAVTLLALGIWLTYLSLPEPARKPIVIPASSTIYRWNEIASALGHKGTNVAVQQPANSFFLTDVEKVVEKVLTRNLQESENS